MFIIDTIFLFQAVLSFICFLLLFKKKGLPCLFELVLFSIFLNYIFNGFRAIVLFPTVVLWIVVLLALNKLFHIPSVPQEECYSIVLGKEEKKKILELLRFFHNLKLKLENEEEKNTALQTKNP